MYNNDRFGSMKDATKKHFFNQTNDDASIFPPPTDYFLLNNDGDVLIDNSNDPFLVV